MELIKINKIYIITDATFPVGMAPTNRILSYANGFLKNGAGCEIIIFRKTEDFGKIINDKTKGSFNGIKYKYLFKNTNKSKYFLKKRIDNLLGLFRLLIYCLFRIQGKSKIIYYSSYNRPAIILKISKIFKGHLILKEESEHPYVYEKSKNYLSLLVFKRIHYNLFDGFLLMTHNLIDYFKQNYPKIPQVHIPMTVDLERFNIVVVKKEKRITYIGSLNNQKDGILYLLKAFSIFLKQFKGYELLICGYVSSNKEKNIFYDTLNKLKIKDSVVYYEKVKSDRIPILLKSSSILVLPRPDSIQAKNGFPTKLGEYLASGVPVVVTPVGEITSYLIDGVSAFIAVSQDANNLASKLKEIISDYQRAVEIGFIGRKVAEKHFNNIIQTQKIINFIQKSFSVRHNR